MIYRISLRLLTISLCLGAITLCLVKAWPADTQDERIEKLEKQVKNQTRIVRYLYWQINARAGSNDPQPIISDELKKILKKGE